MSTWEEIWQVEQQAKDIYHCIKMFPVLGFLEYNPQFKFSVQREGRVSPYHDEGVIKDYLSSCKC